MALSNPLPRFPLRSPDGNTWCDFFILNETTTTDGTPTKIWESSTVSETQAWSIDAFVQTKTSNGSDMTTFRTICSASRQTGQNIVIKDIGPMTRIGSLNASTADIGFVANTSTNTIEFRVTGKTATTLIWSGWLFTLWTS